MERLENNLEQVVTKREATPLDKEFARKVHHEAYHDVVVRQFGKWDEKLGDELFDKAWQPEKYQIIVNNESESGYCSIERHPEEIFIKELVISPKEQGKGIGSKILQEVMAEAKSKNIPLKLQVLKKNYAQNLYRRLGFKDIGSTDTHFQMEFNPTA